MQSVVGVGPTGQQDIDGLLSGTKWGGLSLSYSFPVLASYYEYEGERDTNFSAFTAPQVAAVEKILAALSSVTNLAFSLVSESATQHADMRFALTDLTPTAWAYEPGEGSEAGDAWFSKSSGYFASPEAGGYAYLVMMHEIGHALGLKHGHDTYGFGAVPAGHNSMEFSVMTYASYVGANTSWGFTNEASSYAQTLMMDDIAALQTMYGADYGLNAGDTVYRWNTTTGEFSIDGAGQGRPSGNKILMTIWDGGGADTYDFTNYRTALAIDLNPGAFSTLSKVQLADLSGDGTHLARGNVANALLFEGDTRSLIENAIGGTANDRITGNVADNVLDGRAGRDVLNGGAGDDTLVGGAGADTLIGGEGFDTISYASATRGVVLNLGLSGRSGDAAGDTFSGIEAVLGSRFNDTITGSANADQISGGAGRDTLLGGEGADTLQGGLGKDILTGGAGSDTFLYNSALEGKDTVRDFLSGLDQFRFSAEGFGGGLTAGALDASQFVLGSTASESFGQFIYNAAASKLWWDADGTGAENAALIATLTPGASVAADDIFVV